jgi:hypothetical protein
VTHQKKFCRLAVCFVLVLQGLRGRDQGAGFPAGDTPIPSARTESNEQARRTHFAETYGKLPLSFEENQGQVDEKVKFLSRGSGYTLFLTPTEAVLALSAQSSKPQDQRGARREPRKPPSTKSSVLRMKLIGANPSPQVAGLEELPGKSNYFIGSDSSKWRTNVATYAKVKYREVYPGIDLVYYGNQRQLEYDWIVSPGAETETIRFAIEGAKRTSIDPNGDLVLTVAGGEVRLQKPVVYQETDGVRNEVAGSYVKKTNREIGFRLAEYDAAKPLLIDPVLVYSTYLGGSKSDRGYGIAVDSSGSAYVTGSTGSLNFPTANPLQPPSVGPILYMGDVFVTKFNPTGSALVYSTHLGGIGGDWGYGVAVDSLGNAYVTGRTDSKDFPTANPFQPAYGASNGSEAFVTKLNPTGGALIYSTYLGGNESDEGHGIVVDSSGSAYVTGETWSSTFPTANPLQPLSGGYVDAFVTKFSPSGSTLVYSTYLGGSHEDEGRAIAVDSSGNSYVTGKTFSINFPTANALQPTNAYGSEAFVTKFSASGNGLIYSTYHGGNSWDEAYGIAVDFLGAAYVTGSTWSSDFPMVNPFQAVHAGGGGDVFVTKFNPNGSAQVYSTYLGGTGNESGYGIAVDSTGNASVTGETNSSNFPTANALQPAHGGGNNDAFVTKFDSTGSALIYSTYHGGSGSLESGLGISMDSSGNAYVTGWTNSTNFPAANPLQPVLGDGTYDVFVTKIDYSLPNPVPILKITMSKTTYVDGDTVIASDFRPQNPGASPFAVRARLWLNVPGIGEITVVDGDFTLPANFDQNTGPVTVFAVTQDFPPRGNWQLNSRMTNPTTGALLSEDINLFVIQ